MVGWLNLERSAVSAGIAASPSNDDVAHRTDQLGCTSYLLCMCTCLLPAYCLTLWTSHSACVALSVEVQAIRITTENRNRNRNRNKPKKINQ